VNVILDALDEVYDHIIIVGRREAARRLFEAIQGRFDCGIVVSDGKRRTGAAGESPNMFLGYEVDDITLIRFERPERQTKSNERRGRGAVSGVQHTHVR
jgi:hypothetical protein